MTPRFRLPRERLAHRSLQPVDQLPCLVAIEIGEGGYGTSGSTVGGAGDPGSAGTVPVGFAGTPGSAPAHSNTLGTALGNAQQAYSFGKQVKSFWDRKKSDNGSGLAEVQHDGLAGKLNADGSFTSDSGNAGGSSKMSRVEGAAQGAMGVYSAYQSNGGVGGALTGAMGGMQLGMELGGPMGAVIGAAAGAIVGSIGFGGREKARVYDLKQIRPRIANDTSSYEQGGMDYLSAYSDMQSMDMEAKRTTNAYGPAARSYYQDTIKKEIQQAEAKFTGMQKAGRSQFTATAAQYDQGGWAGNFGSMATGPESGWHICAPKNSWCKNNPQPHMREHLRQSELARATPTWRSTTARTVQRCRHRHSRVGAEISMFMRSMRSLECNG